MPDAKVAVVLVGLQGAVFYKLKEDQKDTVTEDFILQMVVLSTAATMGHVGCSQVGIVIRRGHHHQMPGKHI